MLIKTLTWLLLALLLFGCSQSLYMQGRRHLEKGDFDPAIAAFYQEISVNPTSARAWRELGVAYYEKGDLVKAEDALKQANQIEPDARTHLYFGLIYEQQETYDRALDAYSMSLSLKPGGKTASLIRSHLDRLLMRKLERDAALAVDNESAIDTDTIPANTITQLQNEGGYEQSYGRFETIVRQESNRQHVSSRGLDVALGTVAHNSGIIPSLTDWPPANALPVTGQTVSVIIKGDLDAR